MFEKVIKPSFQILKQRNTNQTYANTRLIKSYYTSPNLLTRLTINLRYYVQRCNKPRCQCCSNLIQYRDQVKINNKIIQINKTANCNTKNVVYIIFCACNKFYIGQTSNPFNLRLNLHRNHIKNPHRAILPVSHHLRKCKTPPKYSYTILFCSDNTLHLETMEQYFIKNLKPDLNSSP